ncbi:hypothetical protein H6763_02570 [Candidatus Nomurabacteria bacterium]|nr:hypothetical protein [Candidatus Nomurabacteria bacterium]
MIDSLIRLFDMTTWYELKILIGASLIISVTFSAFNYYKSRSYKLTAFPMLSLLFSMMTFLLLSYLNEKLFGEMEGGYLQAGFFLTFMITTLNCAIYIFEYSSEIKKKSFDPDHVNRHHFASTLNTVVMMVLLGVSFGFFTPTVLGQTVVITALSSIITVALNHLYAFRSIRDDQ